LIGVYVSLGVLIFLCSFIVWSFVAAQITLRHRLALIEWIAKHNEMKELFDLFNQVTFREHYARLLSFRNPKRLYDPYLFSTFHAMKYGLKESEDK